ncbi:30S ribosomal subunit protein S1 [Candidatus Karelsulcia muelleri str. Sulcia-ALF]|uniref:S1 RNA-binding domain-containing protein n=1 Tax=Candidatus Karelsulcia muelleri TaxID=336810 RepID=UPI000383E21C|nr:S1 RNA-binding domain-containing protein [Candidatus Karelsulcia muelleri]AGS33299.1 30S ribosomal subunit protein S1 [Candidatus Karelsulcia muelleri str. Sulcia-ALF]
MKMDKNMSVEEKNESLILKDIININKNVKLSNFDWSSYELGLGLSKEEQEERKKIEKLYSDTISSIHEFYIYNGKIIKIIDRNVVIDFGFKAEGVISLNEFRDEKKLPKVNDIIEVIVEKLDYKGRCIISYNKAKKLKSWEIIQEKFIKNEIIIFFVAARTKGGLIVVLFGIECFLPGSQIYIKPVKDFDFYVGKTMEGKIVKINNKKKNVVVSHKILIEKYIEIKKKKLISKLEKGQVLRGIVKNITHYGSFIDIGGGIDGLCHITDISWGRIEHPSEKLEIGQTINFVILSIDKIKNRVQLGLKQLQSNPWNSLENEIKKGKVVIGTVTVVTDYGAFVEIFPGVEGLVHVSEMSWAKKLRSSQDYVKIGDRIKVLILNYDISDQKMSLSLKRLTPNPWENIKTKYKMGSIHIVTVRSFTNFGVRLESKFKSELELELKSELEYLLYNDDISWIKNLNNSINIYKKGDLVKLIVLGLDLITRKINFGSKQLIKNFWYENIIGSIHTGKIIKNFYKGAIIKFKKKNLKIFAPILSVKLKKTKFKIIYFNFKIKTFYVSQIF